MKEYIEREAAVAFLENMAASRYLIQCFESNERFPAADVTPVVRGEWIEYSADPNIITCSECDWGTSPEEKGFKYCPHCGAKMDGKSVFEEIKQGLNEAIEYERGNK